MVWLNLLKNSLVFIFKTDIIFPIARDRNEARKQVDDIILSIKTPNTVSRLPRSLKHFDGFKGSEMKFIGLFGLTIAFRDVLDEDLYKHFLSLMEGVWLLLQDCISEEDFLRADECFEHYSKNFAERYARTTRDGDVKEAANTINCHDLEHLVDNCRKFGPLYCSDTTPFESNYGQIIKGLHGTTSVLNGVVWNDYGHKLCAQEAPRAQGQVRLVLCSLTRQMAYVVSFKTDTCHVLGKSIIITDTFSNY